LLSSGVRLRFAAADAGEDARGPRALAFLLRAAVFDPAFFLTFSAISAIVGGEIQ